MSHQLLKAGLPWRPRNNYGNNNNNNNNNNNKGKDTYNNKPTKNKVS